MKTEIFVSYHAIEEALKAGRQVKHLAVCKDSKRIKAIRKEADRREVSLLKVSERRMNEMYPGIEHRGVVLEVTADTAGTKESAVSDLKEYLKDFDDKTALFLLLDGITDPQNYGAILRSADQFAVNLVIIPSRRSVKETGTVVKVSAGASQYVNTLEVPNINRAIEQLKEAGFWVYGADMAGEKVTQAGLDGKVALVMGSEGKGLSRLVRDNCDGFVKIPSYGNIDSLNVSVAAGILLFETRRQQGYFEGDDA